MRRVACIWVCGLELGEGWCETKGRVSGDAGWEWYYVKSATVGAGFCRSGVFVDRLGREHGVLGVIKVLVPKGSVDNRNDGVPTRVSV